MVAVRPDFERIAITGIGLTAPNGNSLPEFRRNLLAGRSGVVPYETRYFGPTVAGVCNFDECGYQRTKDIRRGTRAGSIGIYLLQRSDPRLGPGLGPCRQVGGGHLRRRDRAWQRRDRKRNLPSRRTTTTRSSGRTTTTRGRWPTIRPARSR